MAGKPGLMGRVVGMGSTALDLVGKGAQYALRDPVVAGLGLAGVAGAGYMAYRATNTNNYPTTGAQMEVVNGQPLKVAKGEGMNQSPQYSPQAQSMPSGATMPESSTNPIDTIRPTSDAVLKRRLQVAKEKKSVQEDLGILNLEQYNLQQYTNRTGAGVLY